MGKQNAPYRLFKNPGKSSGKKRSRKRDPFVKANKLLEEEGQKQTLVLFGSAAIALWRNWGKRKVSISSLFKTALVVYNDCASDIRYSMISICEKETGIEIQNGDGKSWKDLTFLNGTFPAEMTGAQWLYMRQQQVRWIRPQIMACVLVSLHRKYHFGYERCAKIYGQIQKIEEEFDADPKRICDACLALTGINVIEAVKGDSRQSKEEK